MTNQIHCILKPPKHFLDKPKITLIKGIKVDGEFIEKNFVSYGMSTPFLLWLFFPPIGPELIYVLLHDKLRYKAKNLPQRLKADFRFYKAMVRGGVNTKRALFILLFVALHSIYRTIFLFVKCDLLGKRKKLRRKSKDV